MGLYIKIWPVRIWLLHYFTYVKTLSLFYLFFLWQHYVWICICLCSESIIIKGYNCSSQWSGNALSVLYLFYWFVLIIPWLVQRRRRRQERWEVRINQFLNLTLLHHLCSWEQDWCECEKTWPPTQKLTKWEVDSEEDKGVEMIRREKKRRSWELAIEESICMFLKIDRLLFFSFFFFGQMD